MIVLFRISYIAIFLLFMVYLLLVYLFGVIVLLLWTPLKKFFHTLNICSVKLTNYLMFCCRTIGIQIFHPFDRRFVFLFLLRANIYFLSWFSNRIVTFVCEKLWHFMKISVDILYVNVPAVGRWYIVMPNQNVPWSYALVKQYFHLTLLFSSYSLLNTQ